MFLQGKERDVHYLAPDNEQPDFPFVYVDWNVDCGKEDEETRISSNVNRDRDRCDYVDYQKGKSISP